MSKNKSKQLLLVAAIIIGLATAGNIIVVFLLNTYISNIQEDLEDIEKKIEDAKLNLDKNSDQLQKIASTYPWYLILNELNSSKKGMLLNNLRRQFYQSIVILRNKQFSSIEKARYDELVFEELENIANYEWENAIERINNKIQLKARLDYKLKRFNSIKDILLLFFGTMQIIGLFIGIYSQYLERSSARTLRD